ncbi:TPA: oligosaccharide flippase family protein, partial [Proteus mirabilis]|nr:oligosaccharide flippase family protein [Proteus mirabilis]
MNKQILHNAIWMMSEKAVSIIGLFLVTSYVARYVGPETFGIIALATAIFQVVQIIAQLGNDNIIFKRVSKNKQSGIKLIKSTFFIRSFIYITITIPLLIYFYSYKDNFTFLFSLAISIACYFSSID